MFFARAAGGAAFVASLFPFLDAGLALQIWLSVHNSGKSLFVVRTLLEFMPCAVSFRPS